MIPENGSRSVISEGESCHCGKLHLPFAAAITEALPEASHVADRWHLAKNLTEHLDKVVSARWKQLTKAAGEAEMPAEPLPVFPSARRPRQPVGEARYQQMLALQEAGLPTGVIANPL